MAAFKNYGTYDLPHTAIQANIAPGETCFVWEKIILAFQMPLLFLISGYTAGYSFPNKNTSIFIKKKTLRLFVPYLSWEVLHYSIACVLPNDYRNFSVRSILEEIFISDFWFLRMLFVFFVALWLCNLILNIIKQDDNKNIVLLMLLVAGGAPLLLGRLPLLSMSSSVWYYLWFIVGYASYLMLQSDKWKAIYKNRIVLYILRGAPIIIMFLTVIVISFYTISSKIVSVVFTFGIIVVTLMFEGYFPESVQRYLILLGKNTLPIYAIHWCLLFSPLWRMDFYVRLFGNLPLFFCSLLTTVVWISICMIMIKGLKMNWVLQMIFLGEC